MEPENQPLEKEIMALEAIIFRFHSLHQNPSKRIGFPRAIPTAGYAYRHHRSAAENGRPAAWGKVLAMQQALEESDWNTGVKVRKTLGGEP